MTTTEQITRARRLVELLEAQARGETIQYEDHGKWVDVMREIQIEFFLQGHVDYRIKPKLPTPPEGYEYVTGFPVRPSRDWLIWADRSGTWRGLTLDASEHHCEPGGLYARPIRKASIPDGLFWVRYSGSPERERLVTIVEGGFMHYSTPRSDKSGDNKLSLGSAAEHWHYSHDRKSWFNFYGEAVAP